MEFKTKSERFVLSKKDQWQRLHDILTKINRDGFRKLNEEEIQTFPRLFRLTCADLAEAKMLQLSPDVMDYLNQLIGQAHKFLYSFPPVNKSQIKSFFVDQLPFIILKNWIFVLLSAFLFFSSFGITYTIIRQKPALAARIVPSQTLIQMEESYRSGITKERSFTTKNFMVSFYIQNNISIAFGCFALGVLLGIGTIYILLYNGIALGAITGYVIGKGYGKNFYTFTTAHSAAELTGLILAGASGLVLGFAIIKATRYYRKEWLAIERPNIFSLVAGSACLLFLAAMIEGIISPSLLPYSIKAGLAILTLSLIGGYFFLWPGLRMLRLNRTNAQPTGVPK
jgi:uncharacterized membrane protein SpoIIM required for sporulation